MDEFLKKLDPKTASLVMVGVTVLLLAALAMYVVVPEVKAYRKSVSTLEVLQRVANNGDQTGQEMALMQQDVDGLVKRLHGDMVNMPKNQMEAFIIGRLQRISWRNNMELRSVKPGKGGAVHMFEEVLFDVEVSGEYFDLYAWLQELGEELGYVVVKHFSIGQQSGADAGARVKARLTIVSYREAGNA
jgi:hypothetical protein